MALLPENPGDFTDITLIWYFSSAILQTESISSPITPTIHVAYINMTLG